MTLFKSITGTTLEVLRDGTPRIFQIDEQFLNEVKMWPSGIEVEIKFDESTEKYKIKPKGGSGHSIYGLKTY